MNPRRGRQMTLRAPMLTQGLGDQKHSRQPGGSSFASLAGEGAPRVGRRDGSPPLYPTRQRPYAGPRCLQAGRSEAAGPQSVHAKAGWAQRRRWCAATNEQAARFCTPSWLEGARRYSAAHTRPEARSGGPRSSYIEHAHAVRPRGPTHNARASDYRGDARIITPPAGKWRSHWNRSKNQ